MNNAFLYIGAAYKFFRTEAVLNKVLAIFFIPPLTLSFLMDFVIQNYSAFIQSVTGISTKEITITSIVLEALFTLWVLWGYGCVFSYMRTIVKNKHSTDMQSFADVCLAGKKIVLPLFLTNILRECITILWVIPYFLCVLVYLFTLAPLEINAFVDSIQSLFIGAETTTGTPPVLSVSPQIVSVLLLLLPLLLPSLYYRLKTIFYDIIIGVEGKAYRDALQSSSQLVKNKFWHMVHTMLVLVLCTFLPAAIISGIGNYVLISVNPLLEVLSVLIYGTALSIATLLFIIASTFYYKDLLPTS